MKSAVVTLTFLSIFSAFYVFARDASADVPADDAPQQKESDKVSDTSQCNGLVQEYKGLQLVSAQIDPDTLQAVLVYYKKLADGKILLFRIIRQGCKEPWVEAGVKVIEMKKPACVPSDSTQCL